MTTEVEKAKEGRPVIIHWMYPDEDGPIKTGEWSCGKGGSWRIACMPTRQIVLGLFCSDAPYVINCSRCRKHKDFPLERAEVPEVAEEYIVDEVRALFLPKEE